jgi:hypothetical protein
MWDLLYSSLIITFTYNRPISTVTHPIYIIIIIIIIIIVPTFLFIGLTSLILTYSIPPALSYKFLLIPYLSSLHLPTSLPSRPPHLTFKLTYCCTE